jgi:acetylornithine deacetylase/succinyl-diaminopimelate desuccinylase-like protein
MDLQEETAEVLATLIRFRTVNPPGNERECQQWLADYLSDAGLDVELDGAEPERPNLVATYRGGDGPTLGYLSHVDTVLADAEDWTADPWGAELRDGFLYGRGTIDMKNQTAAEAVAAAHLARSGARFGGTLKVISVADEETGGILGAKWITEERPDLSRVDYLLNEGGGSVIPYGDRSGRERAAQARAGDHEARRRPPGLRSHRGHRRAAGGARRGPGRPGGRPETRARRLARVRAAARRRDERHVRADDRLGGREDQRDPGPRAGARRLPGPARDG